MHKVHIIFGKQGAGKSTYSKKLAQEVEGVHFSIDEWMWNLYGEDMPKSMNLTWIFERVNRCEKQIWRMVKRISDCEIDVILDLGFTKFEKRELFLSLTKEHNIAVQIHYLKAPLELRKKRVLERNKDKGDTYSFEVTSGMFDFMESEFEVPRKKELEKAIIIDTSKIDVRKASS